MNDNEKAEPVFNVLQNANVSNTLFLRFRQVHTLIHLVDDVVEHARVNELRQSIARIIGLISTQIHHRVILTGDSKSSCGHHLNQIVVFNLQSIEIAYT